MADPLQDYLSTLPELSTARGQFLWSSFPARKESNPTGYTGAIQWWRATLTTLLSKGLLGDDKLILSVNESLRDGFKREKLGRPLSLGAVITETSQRGEFVRLENFLSADSDKISSASWFSLVTKPISWAASKAFGSTAVGEGYDEKQWSVSQGEWVVKELVERAASNLMAKLTDLHSDPVSRLYTIKSFRSRLGEICLPGQISSERDCCVLAKHLADKGLCTIRDEVIKFGAPLSTSTTISPITESDRGILTLTATLTSLSNSIASIEDRIAQEQAKIVSSHAQKQILLVKSHLIARKQLENLLSQRIGSRDKLQTVLIGIEKATGDEEIVSAMELGARTLKQILQSPQLKLEKVEETIEAMDDALAQGEEINQAISQAGQLNPNEEDEVENELKEMLKQAEEEENAKKEADEIKSSQQSEAKPAEAKEEKVESGVDTLERKAARLSLDENEAAETERKRVEKLEQNLTFNSAPQTQLGANEKEVQRTKELAQ